MSRLFSCFFTGLKKDKIKNEISESYQIKKFSLLLLNIILVNEKKY